jgi:Tol biopolymer transport system component
VAFSGNTWLVRGDLATRTVTTMRSDDECPSLSPDGTRLVYKKQLGQKRGQWRLVAMDLATGTETKLAETRSVDDQVEWLDDNHVMYAVLGSCGDPYLEDVYSVPADGTGRPSVLIAHGSSPAVVR